MLEYERVRRHWFPRLPGLGPDTFPVFPALRRMRTPGSPCLSHTCTEARQVNLIHRDRPTSAGDGTRPPGFVIFSPLNGLPKALPGTDAPRPDTGRARKLQPSWHATRSDIPHRGR